MLKVLRFCFVRKSDKYSTLFRRSTVTAALQQCDVCGSIGRQKLLKAEDKLKGLKYRAVGNKNLIQNVHDPRLGLRFTLQPYNDSKCNQDKIHSLATFTLPSKVNLFFGAQL